MTAAAPTGLTVDDIEAPLHLGRHARLAWVSAERFEAAEVRISDAAGNPVWESGMLAGSHPVRVIDTAQLDSRTTYQWAVRVWTSGAGPSAWSSPVTVETALLHERDRVGLWISRAVPAANRIVRSVEHDRTDVVGPSETLGQTFNVEGPFTALTVDLIGVRGVTTEADLTLTRLVDETVIASQHLHPVQFPGDRFAHWMHLDEAAPAGEYLVQLSPTRGTVGWRTSNAPAPIADATPGVYPIALSGTARQNGRVVDGRRSIGVETTPAANPEFRRVFQIESEVTRARLTLSALGYARAAINGKPVAKDVLEPAPTSTAHRVLTRTYDVTSLLEVGANEILIECGRGYVGTRGASTWSWNLAPDHQEPAAFAELHLTDSAGDVSIVATDAQWQARESVVRFDSLYGGETHDPTAAVEAWSDAQTVRAPAGTLEAATHPSVQPHAPMSPVHSLAVTDTAVVHDFGAVTAGWVRLIAHGAPGDRITVEYAEQTDHDGDIVFENVLAAGRAQVDEFVIGHDFQLEVIEPKFTYKGFRYARVTAPPTTVVTAAAAVPVHTAVAAAGEFRSSEPLLNWIDEATARSLLNNLHGIPTDTPAYEKNGWTADAHLVAETAVHHFDLRAFFEKWLRDHADAQLDDGTIPQIVPTPGWGLDPDPAWAASYPLIVWNLYWEYGDLHILEEHSERLVRYVRQLIDLVQDSGWLWTAHSWGDWLSPGHHFAPEGPTPTATLMMLKSIQVVRRVLETLGRGAETEWLQSAEQHITGAYNDTYLGDGFYRAAGVGYRQVMNILPLAFDVVPPSVKQDVVESLVQDLERRTGQHLDVGSIGTKYILPTLTSAGRGDLALAIATQLDRPGWGLWQQSGSSTLWESWDENVRSHDHYFLGSIGQWLHEGVAGVTPTSAGWASCSLTPATITGIDSAQYGHETPYGRLAFAWARTLTGLLCQIEVPSGITAVLDLSHLADGRVTLDEAAVKTDDHLVVPPGRHQVEWTEYEQLSHLVRA